MLDNVDAAETSNNGNAGFDPGTNHNFLSDCAATILERYARAKSATKSSLEDLRVVGERLNEAKEVLVGQKGAFGQWCEAQNFPFDKTWRARLMKLAANWSAIMEAVEALPEDKRKWSVDGVLAIWQAAERAKNEPEGDNAGEGAGEGGEKPQRQRKETEAERLRRQLAEALAEIERLRGEVEALKGVGSKAKTEEPKAKAKADPKAEAKVDAATKARARKVWGLYTKGATEGEKAAAKARLDEMAAKSGLPFDAFVAACGLA
ncbi:hypothetical protein AZC_3573 [Azorhizobium caulinodans ORS 571]|uniref:Uncharacterized protein n=1 Tax=Azorhizobium caulinodans (strain ATCC 43989 / DSM 5975 / JCM 20966 / LMG 6465 / NBRC 14845 / NCIMB 13405 / ORS 571) TaxID=438753 RepID=A8IF42_AZOC5|nr:hypothetical protein [Azorhizobium caulinodans]BAF89571.1 hypothetical protein AZC_3573 [Azorhizobium caulinodans ORS 571]